MTQSISRVSKYINNGSMKEFFSSLKAGMFYGKSLKHLKN